MGNSSYVNCINYHTAACTQYISDKLQKKMLNVRNCNAKCSLMLNPEIIWNESLNVVRDLQDAPEKITSASIHVKNSLI